MTVKNFMGTDLFAAVKKMEKEISYDREKLIEAIRNAKIEGVKLLDDNMAEISLSTIMENNEILEPSYYLQSSQAKCIETALAGQPLTVLSKLKKIQQEGKAGNVKLNETTMRIINESTLGQLALIA